jgi:flagellar hook-basal body complex protein FliE
MKFRLFAIVMILAVAFASIGAVSADARRSAAKKRIAAKLTAMLPPSDAIAFFDANKFFTEALPRILASDPNSLASVNTKLAEIENKTGIDLRRFDSMAVGVAFKKVSATETDYETVAVASGEIDAGSMIAVAKLAAKGKYREESANGKTIYVFNSKEIVAENLPNRPNSKVADFIEKALNSLTKDIAVASAGPNTLVLGTPSRVREALAIAGDARSSLTTQLTINDATVMAFTIKEAGALTSLLPVDNDELGKNVASIKKLSGNLDMNLSGIKLSLLAHTARPEQALALKDMLAGLQFVGNAIFGNSKRKDQQVYGRILKGAQMTSKGNTVSVVVPVQQSDIDILISGLR